MQTVQQKLQYRVRDYVLNALLGIRSYVPQAPKNLNKHITSQLRLKDLYLPVQNSIYHDLKRQFRLIRCRNVSNYLNATLK